MAVAATTTLRINGLPKRKMAELTAKARRLKLTPAAYVKRLVEEDLALDREAKSRSLAEVFGPGRHVDEQELDRLVDEARSRHYQRTKKR